MEKKIKDIELIGNVDSDFQDPIKFIDEIIERSDELEDTLENQRLILDSLIRKFIEKAFCFNLYS